MVVSDSVVDISSFINGRRIGGFQIIVVLLCALTVFFDGYDTQSVAFVAPSIAAQWHLSREALGPLFVASLFGLLIGSALFGLVADKLGRRNIIMLATLIFGVCTLGTAQAGGISELLIFRFLAGLGLGGAMPNAIALTAEYCPERRRATVVMIMFTGFSIGAAAGGALAAVLIPHFGWRAVWYVGGAIPILLVPLQWALLPESLRYLVVSGATRERIEQLVRRIDRGFLVPADARYQSGEARAEGVPVAHLFRDGRALGTVLLWIVFFANLLDIFLLQNWIPVISHSAGLSVQKAVVVGTLFQVGGVVAALLIGLVMDRYGSCRTLALLYAVGCVFAIVLGLAGSSEEALMVLTFLVGFSVVGGQNAANALSAIFYPTAMRSTGVGWALGIGRIGAIVGPLLGAFLLSQHWPDSSLFFVGAVPLFIAMLAVIALGRRYKGI